MKKLNKNSQYKREYRALLSPLGANTENNTDNNYMVQGYAIIFNRPYEIFKADGIKYFEEIDNKALDEADLSDVVMRYDHTGKVLARLSNGTLGLEIQPNGLYVSANLSKSQEARNLYEEIKNGLINKMSWAFVAKEDFYDRETRTRKILKIAKVYDVSAVCYPANGDTDISARSYFDGVIEMERQELLARQKLLELEKMKYFF